MAGNKAGFIYYNVDTDRYQDIKIKRLKKEFKGTGVAVYDYILAEVYRDKGCYLVWHDSVIFDVADYWGISEDVVKRIVLFCGEIGLFSAPMLRKNIITAKSIQSRYDDMCKRAKRKMAEIPEECAIIPEEQIKNSEELFILPEESPQSRVKESRVKKRKVEKSKEKVEAASLASGIIKNYWKLWIDEWFVFYKKRNSDIEPAFNGVQGKALTSIKKHLEKISIPAKNKDSPEDCKEELGYKSWQYVLKNWDKLDDWIKGQFDLTVINKKINDIISQLKNGKSDSKNKSKQSGSNVNTKSALSKIDKVFASDGGP